MKFVTLQLISVWPRVHMVSIRINCCVTYISRVLRDMEVYECIGTLSLPTVNTLLVVCLTAGLEIILNLLQLKLSIPLCFQALRLNQ